MDDPVSDALPVLHSDIADANAAIEQLRRLQRVTDATLGNLSADELLDELLIRVRHELHADTAAVLLLDADAGELVARAAKGLEEEVSAGVRIPLGKGFAGKIAAERVPVVLTKVDHSNVLNPILRQVGVRSLLGVPLLVQGNLLGVMHVGTLSVRHFSQADVHLLQLVAERVALALNARLHERERFVADTLQRSFLPEVLPRIAGLLMASRYLPAAAGIQVGGDWFDAFELGDGSLGVAIGDVAGRGLAAATLMGRIRNALRAYAFEEHPPAEVAKLLDRLVAHFDPGDLVTLLYGVFDPSLRSFRYVVAGHLPPLLLAGTGTRLLEHDRGYDPPLGTDLPGSFTEHRIELLPGQGLLLYTDGLVERREESLSLSLVRLGELAARVSRPIDPEIAIEAIVTGVAAARTDDDVALLLLVRTEGPGASLEITVPARPKELAGMRRALRRWLAGLQVGETSAYDILTACGEACANAIEHAYPAGEGTVNVHGTSGDGKVSLVIRDTGRWREPRSEDRGRGISLMRAMMDEVEVDHGPEGTTVTLTRRIERPS